MYGLKYSRILEWEQLIILLKPHGYAPCERTVVICKHTSLPFDFPLVVDDLEVK